MSSDVPVQSTENPGQPPEFFLFLADLIQLYALNDNPSILMLSYGSQRASIGLADGRIIHAQIGDQKGPEAFYTIMRWEKGELSRRLIRRSSESSVTEDLSTILMNAYDHVMTHGVLNAAQLSSLDTPPTLALPSTLEEHTSTALETDVRQTLTEAHPYRHYFRLVWGETLRSELNSIEGFRSFQLFDLNKNVTSMRSTIVEPKATSLVENILEALYKSEVVDQDLELYLRLPASYMAFIRLPLGNHILSASFSLDGTTPAMIQFKLKQIIEKLPHPTAKALS